MEILAIISLAGNILQFAEAGARLAANAAKLYHSASGRLPEHEQLGAGAADVRRLMEAMQGHQGTIKDRELNQLVGRCWEASDELLSLLDGLGLRGADRSLLKSVSRSLQAARRKPRLAELESRLGSIRGQICARLAFLTSKQQDLTLELLSQLHHDVLESLNWKRVALGKVDDLAARVEAAIKDGGADAARRERLLQEFVRQTKEVEQQKHVLDSLYFKKMMARQSDITDAHNETFKWILTDESGANFVPWLRDDANTDLYWVAGKAGSGKSTLMKFVSRHERTRRLLAAWTGSKRLLVAVHYFWNAGHALQKSQEGLFRTLLCQILSFHPELMPVVIGPEVEDELGGVTRSAWTPAILVKVLKSIAAIDPLPFRLCVFIDGLDEYSGDHRELIGILRTLAGSPDIKICASSRPWLNFLDAFDGKPWKVYLQDLTKSDIRQYVGDNLIMDDRFQELDRRASGSGYAESFVSEIESKAQGVFLWVILVVRSLREGLKNGDYLPELHRRLHELPGDLDAYFKVIFDSIEPVYRLLTARIFKVLAVAGSVPVLLVHYMYQEHARPGFCLSEPACLQEPGERLAEVAVRERRRIIAQCRDLVFVSAKRSEPELLRFSAGFLHRTVKDFVQLRHIDEQLDSQAGAGFDPNLAVAQARLTFIKAQQDCLFHRGEPVTSGETWTPRRPDAEAGGGGGGGGHCHDCHRLAEVGRQLEEMMAQAGAWGYLGDRAVELLDHLERTVGQTPYFRAHSGQCRTFVQYAAHWRAGWYVAAKRDSLGAAEAASVLQGVLRGHAVRSRESSSCFCRRHDPFWLDAQRRPAAQRQSYSRLDVAWLERLLGLRLSPNLVLPSEATVWEDFLAFTRTWPSHALKEPCRALLRHGARTDIDVNVEGQLVPVEDFLERIFEGQELAKVMASLGSRPDGRREAGLECQAGALPASGLVSFAGHEEWTTDGGGEGLGDQARDVYLNWRLPRAVARE